MRLQIHPNGAAAVWRAAVVGVIGTAGFVGGGAQAVAGVHSFHGLPTSSGNRVAHTEAEVYQGDDASPHAPGSRVTHTVQVDLLDAAPSYRVLWTNTAGFRFTGTLQALEEVAYVGTRYTTTHTGFEEVDGHIEFSPAETPPGAFVSGSAPSYRLYPAGPLETAARAAGNIFSAVSAPITRFLEPDPDLLRAVDQAPPPEFTTSVEFRSILTQLGPASYEYRYVVTNLTPDPLTFEWGGASGTVGGDTDPTVLTDNVHTRIVLSNLPGIEIEGLAAFELEGRIGEGSTTANMFVPVPEPASLAVLAWVPIVARRRRRCDPGLAYAAIQN